MKSDNQFGSLVPGSMQEKFGTWIDNGTLSLLDFHRQQRDISAQKEVIRYADGQNCMICW
jgi:hypothetical protein